VNLFFFSKYILGLRVEIHFGWLAGQVEFQLSGSYPPKQLPFS
jgi:hypothetical protein